MLTITVFILITLFSFVYSVKQYDTLNKSRINKVSDFYILLCLFIHNIITVFILLGWLLGILTKNKSILILHILTVLIVLIMWRMNNNYCILTLYLNRKLDLPHRETFHDFQEVVTGNNKHSKTNIQVPVLITAITFSIIGLLIN
jgi:hypothetical protein